MIFVVRIRMLLKEPFAFVVEFIASINQQIETITPGKRLTKTQRT